MILGVQVVHAWRRLRERRRAAALHRTSASAYESYVLARADASGEQLLPHCQAEVLHAPGVCRYCDDRPDLQDIRRRMGLPFSSPEANGWAGNVARPHGT